MFSLFFFFRLLFLLNVWSVLHISTACDYFSLSWMSPLSVNVVFFRWTSAMHFYKQLNLVLFEFLSVSFIFFLSEFSHWMNVLFFFFSIWRNVPFGVVLHFLSSMLYMFHRIPCRCLTITCESQSFTVTQGDMFSENVTNFSPFLSHCR